MNTLRKTLATAALALLAGSAFAYTTVFNLPATQNGKKAILYNVDTEQPTDSVVVKDGRAIFSTDYIKPYMAILNIDGQTVVNQVIVDQADVVVDVQLTDVGPTFTATGGLNDRLKDFTDDLEATVQKFNSGQVNTMGETLSEALHDKILNTTKNNMENPLGYYVLVSMGKEWLQNDLAGLERDFPNIMQYKKVRDLYALVRGLEKTQPGKKFIDFDITYEDQTHKLSDVVGKGDYVLLDFWASWCGPCRREMPRIHRIQKKYEGKNFKVLGIAVWDEPKETLAAMDQLKLPWEIWLKGGEDITNLYGVDSIPCLILFGPDGKILARNLTAAQMEEFIAKQIK